VGRAGAEVVPVGGARCRATVWRRSVAGGRHTVGNSEAAEAPCAGAGLGL
jgi:hypothetical protein